MASRKKSSPESAEQTPVQPAPIEPAEPGNREETAGPGEVTEEAQAETALNAAEISAFIEQGDVRPALDESAALKPILEAVIYITDEPLSAQQLAAALEKPIDQVQRLLDELVAEFSKAEHGLAIREIAGGYKMATKAEHHEAVRGFVKKLTPPLKLSLAALETLAVIAYKQPVTAPEIMDIRGVQGASVLKTLLDRKLVTEAGRKNVVGKPILYKTTKDFLVQFGLKSLNELPTLKEFEELARMSVGEDEAPAAATGDVADAPAHQKGTEEQTEPPRTEGTPEERQAPAEQADAGLGESAEQSQPVPEEEPLRQEARAEAEHVSAEPAQTESAEASATSAKANETQPD